MQAVRVLANILNFGECPEKSTDIIRSSSLPTLLITIIKNLMKSDLVPVCIELMSELMYATALLSKHCYSKEIGIEPIYMKHMIPMFVPLIQSSTNKHVMLAVIKSIGVFVCQAQITPVRMQNFYKECMN